MSNETQHPSSFRDPAGFIFEHDRVYYRQVNQSYAKHFDRLVTSGLYKRLTESDLLIEHVSACLSLAQTGEAYCVLRPEQMPYISYPYEWCFGQLQAAARATLQIQRIALEYGMSLKDASAFNMQFLRGMPVLIDTLSFIPYQEGEPWPPYRQFCQHFLAPLALMAYRDIRLGRLLSSYLDGIPLDLAARLLPLASRFSLPLLLHMHLHAAGQKRLARRSNSKAQLRAKFTKRAMLGLLDSLEAAIARFRWEPRRSGWAGYAPGESYSAGGVEHKMRLVAEFLDHTAPQFVLDLGANTGDFSRLASRRQIFTVAVDNDPGAVELNYRRAEHEHDPYILPLWIDLANPSPSLGWENRERASLSDRGPADVVMALALVHHLAIANNVPLAKVAQFFARMARRLIIEFLPKSDARVQQMLMFRDDIFSDYTQEVFEMEFGAYFEIYRVERIRNSVRILYLMERRRA